MSKRNQESLKDRIVRALGAFETDQYVPWRMVRIGIDARDTNLAFALVDLVRMKLVATEQPFEADLLRERAEIWEGMGLRLTASGWQQLAELYRNDATNIAVQSGPGHALRVAWAGVLFGVMSLTGQVLHIKDVHDRDRIESTSTGSPREQAGPVIDMPGTEPKKPMEPEGASDVVDSLRDLK